MIDIKKELGKKGIKPDITKDQHFLTNEKVIGTAIEMAQLNENDIVLEIGAGIGNITSELARVAGKVIAVEIDARFKPFLERLPENVEIHFEDAHTFVSQGGKFRKKKVFNKIVSNMPYQLAEWLMHNLAFVEYDKAILMVPKRFMTTIDTNPIFKSFYRLGEFVEVGKTDFYPQPKTNSVLLDLIRLGDPITTNDLALFLRQFIYQHEEWKTKNSLREGLITYARLVYKKTLTKNQARRIIQKVQIQQELQGDTAHNLKIYDEISNKFDDENTLKLFENGYKSKL
jgi:16S rRNA (adenine1518-N6/adenine1519-N6)-dimethyltransferase